jgi:hypothetical protein
VSRTVPANGLVVVVVRVLRLTITATSALVAMAALESCQTSQGKKRHMLVAEVVAAAFTATLFPARVWTVVVMAAHRGGPVDKTQTPERPTLVVVAVALALGMAAQTLDNPAALADQVF